ncbi:MAG: PAS domain S-box protein, partial [Flavobacteriales bacterium]|nr:PAS domain S-box protein [Flavobacteriales bacterium]
MKKTDTAKSQIFSVIEELFLILENPKLKTKQIEETFSKLNGVLNADHIYFLKKSAKQFIPYFSKIYSVNRNKKHEKINESLEFGNVSTKLISYWKSELLKGREISQFTFNTNDQDLTRSLFDQHISYYFIVPIICSHQLVGVLGFNWLQKDEALNPDEIRFARIFAKAFCNLTLKRRSYKRALKNERKYKQIISNIQDIVFKLNEKLEITYLNGAWSKMTDRDIHECIGLPIAQFLESEGAQKLKSRIESLESTGEKSCSVRTAFIKPDGSLYYIRINVKRILKDVRSEYFGTINDIHQGQLNFNLLKESESKFKSLFETVEDVLYSLDADTGRLLIISDKIERFGFKKEQFLEDSEFWTRQIVEEDRAAVQKAYGEFVAQRLPYFEMEYRVQTPSGRIIWIYDRSGIEYDSNKNAL